MDRRKHGSRESSWSTLVDSYHDGGETPEVVVNVDGNCNSPSTISAAEGGGGGGGNVSVQSSNCSSTANTPRTGEAASKGWGSWSSGTPSPRSFSFKNRPPQPPSSTHSPNHMAHCGDDPSTRLISSFLRTQATSGAHLSLDLDLEMEELRKPAQSRTRASISASRELRVSFQESHKRSSSSPSSSDSDVSAGRKPDPNARDTAEVIRCTSISTGPGPLLRTRTRSRLMDPLPSASAPCIDEDRKSSVIRAPARSGPIRSGLIGMSGPIGKSDHFDDEDDDPFIDEDIPTGFKRGKLDTLTILQWVSLVLIVAALACTLCIPSLRNKKLWRLHLWRWEVLVLVLICGRLVSGWVILIAVFFIERNFLLRKRVLYFVYGVRHAVQNALWLSLVLVCWNVLFQKGVEREAQRLVVPYVTKVLSCLLVATLIRLVKTLLLKVLASSFHVSTYFDRIQEALFNQYVIETLSGPPLVDESRMLAEVHKLQCAGATIPDELQEAAMPSKPVLAQKSGLLSGPVSRLDVSKQLQRERQERQFDDGITIDQLHRFNQKNISAWNMKRLIKIVRYGTLTTMDEQIRHARGEGDESATQIRSEYEARVAAKRIFNNVAKPGSKYIYLSDLMRFMRKEEAIKAASLFEGAQEHSRVSKRSLKNWVVNAFRERKALALTLNDTKTAVNKLHQISNVVVMVVVFALWLLILGIATTRFFVFLSSQLVLTVFMFGNTLKTMFEAIIFLFVMHPFDVGDRCEVDGVQVVVEEMNIMTTIFLRYDNLKIYHPNSVLATMPIMNYYRSPDMGEAIDFAIHVATPLEKVALVKERILHYINSKKEHWYPGAMVVLRDVDDTNKLKVSIWFQHTINFQDMGMRFERRELVLQEMIKILKDLDIEYRMLPLDVNVRNAPPIQSTRMPTTWTGYS